jgi:glycerol-3-phosphate acyltransferase PlsX
MRIAVDTMGGELGSEFPVQGAVDALARRQELEVILLGPRDLLAKHLQSISGLTENISKRLSIEHAPQVIGMDESPVDAVRKKKDSTIMVGFSIVREGRADGVVSAGNSGATMAAAIRSLGRLKGVSRPGIGSFLPTVKKPVMLMDVGANVDCRPQHLFQFGFMASCCSQLLNNIERPRVGLLSIGEEAAKGNLLVKETHELLLDSSLNFIGNVEGRDIYKGDVDVVICDGFVGNVALKVSEGLADAAMQMLKTEIMKSWRAKIGYLLSRNAFARFRQRVDYAEYGGAPLLGINGVAIICHGTSCAMAIQNGILVAADMVQYKVNDGIIRALADYEHQ